jgi:hypothetical protein
MASEAQKQGALLNSGFLNTLGSKDPGLRLDGVEQVFVKYMGKLVQRLVSRIDQAGPDGREVTASGNLSSNIRFEYTHIGMRYTGNVFMPDYADFRDKGIQGLGADNQNTTSPYRFKFRHPSKKHVAAIEQWIKEKNNLAIVTAPKGLTDIVKEQKSLAYIFAASARRKGIKAANFKQGAIDDILPDFARELSAALGKDIAVSIKLSNLN